jgi:hypothetical protein
MPIGQCVMQVVAIAATDHQSFGSQQPEALRNGGEFFTQNIDQFTHAPLALL